MSEYETNNNIIAQPDIGEIQAELFIRTMPDTLYRVDANGRLNYVSPSAERLTGYTCSELIGKQITDLYVRPEERGEFLARLKESNGILNDYETEIRHKSGHGVWLLINVRGIFDRARQLIGIEGLIRDISKLKKIEKELHHEKEMAQITLNSITDGVITTDTNGKIVYMNPAAENMTNWKREQARGRDIQEVFSPHASEGDRQIEHPALSCLKSGENVIAPCIRLLKKDPQSEYAIRETASSIHNNNNEIIGIVLVFHDVTEVREMSRKLSYQATHDSHTGLINRAEFEKRLAGAIKSAHDKQIQHVVCYLDLDQFKVVNDTCGHIAGDELLQQLTGTLQTHVREKDTFARVGGDEFGILIECCGLESGIRIAESIRKAVSNFRFSWDNKLFEVGVSIGLTLVDQNSQDTTEILSTADAACFVAKDMGRNRIHVFQKDDAAISKQHTEMHWSHKIKHALENDNFVLYSQRLQCINHSSHSEPVYHEALIRLNQDNKIIPPDEFLPAAERYNLMQYIDRWVVRNVFQRLSTIDKKQDNQHIFAINLSGTSFTDKRFLSYMLAEIENFNINPAMICFEITETAAISNLELAKRFIQILKNMGFHFALDDFGSGLSSFNYLQYLPVNFLKIDGNIVRDIHKNDVSHAMVESINKIGHVMGAKTIAEYVENQDILTCLQDIGVDYAQGYLISRPAPFEDLEKP